MDTENFLVRRRDLTERLYERRVRDRSTYPLPLGTHFGLELPLWARCALSLMPRGGLVSSLLQIGLPLAAPFVFRKKVPWINRLLTHFLPSKA